MQMSELNMCSDLLMHRKLYELQFQYIYFALVHKLNNDKFIAGFFMIEAKISVGKLFGLYVIEMEKIA